MPNYSAIQCQTIWRFSKSWFARVNALCNLSRKKSREVAASLSGRFLRRRCFTLCITVEVEATNATTVAVAKITGESGWRVGEKSVFASFFA